jgi:hypothetical protein
MDPASSSPEPHQLLAPFILGFAGGSRGKRSARFSGFRVTEFRLARVASAEISASRLTANSGCYRWRSAIVSIIATVLLSDYTNRSISEEVGSPECDGSGER